MTPAAAGTSSPLSPAQRRMWFLHQLAPEVPAYNICTAIELTGEPHPAALREVVRRLGLRHEALRTVFESTGDAPRQRAADRPAPLRAVDLGGLTDADREAEIERTLRRIAARPFRLDTGPPAEWTLLRCGARRRLLVLCAHHIVFDGGSLAVVCRELEEGYAAALAGRPGPLAAPGPSYAGRCAARPREDDEAGREFWRRELAGAPARTAVLRRTGRPGGGPPARATVPCGAGDLVAAAALCREEGVTSYMLLLAALACLVGRYTGQRDVVIGSPVSLREDDEQLAAVGPLINMLPLRIRLHGDPGFGEVLARTREALLGALEHRTTPFEDIVDAVGADREPDLSPLFQILFAYERPAPQPALPGVRGRIVPVPAAAAKYELAVTATETPGGLELTAEADHGYGHPGELAAFAGHFGVLLAAAVRAPDTPLSRLPLLTAEESRRLADSAPAGTARQEADRPVHRLVERTAARRPDAVAVVAGTAHVSYREFNARANRRAARLRRAGVATEDVVAVWLERGLELPLSLLAVLKSGAAYLPVDPGLPVERVRLMLADAHASLLITDSGLGDRLDPADVPQLRVDEPAPPAHEGDSADHAGPDRPAGLAYLLYTSGSTGRPKAVAIQHDSATAFLQWAGRAFGAGEMSAVLATTSAGFDLSVFELFAPLAHGGTVLLADSALHVGALPWAPAATLLNTVPSAAAALLDAGGLPDGLTAVNLAGEPLAGELADRLYARLPGAVVRNLYGPSEATTYATMARVPAGGGRPPAIGRAVGPARVWTADAWGRPVPGAVVGELLIGGTAPARGYLGRPGPTAEAFRPDPYGPPGSRLYRTGDLALRRPDGEFVFVGRADTQVKLRGVRIELGEVEAALRDCAPVAEAAAVVVGATAETRRLVGFVSPLPGEHVEVERTLAALRARLPAIFVPAVLVVRDALPHTANGKTDRAALARLADGHRPAGGSYTPPRTPLEKAIAEVWCDVLGVERVGIHQAFFDAGGNSLSLLRVHRRLATGVRADLRLVDVFRLPTIAALAAFLDDGGGGADGGDGARDGAVAEAARRAGRRRAAVGARRREGGHR
ncbi:amino acid adenylation domain-containing protein [Streptomyces sp. NPDC053079]|uniref:amino acid adenylation domain-containing protein n=1 Tax=Streptomyces sp. NPDC053079 TaxID=3365697 RepID=UPI0037D2845C